MKKIVESINVDVHDKTKNFVESFDIKVEVDEKNKKNSTKLITKSSIRSMLMFMTKPKISSNRSISKLKSMKKTKKFDEVDNKIVDSINVDVHDKTKTFG